MRLHASEHVRGLDLQALTLVFAAANGVATCTGFRAMMDGQGLLSPLLVTVAVQGLILVAVHRLVRAGGGRRTADLVRRALRRALPRGGGVGRRDPRRCRGLRPESARRR